MLSFNTQYYLKNIKERLMLSRLNYRINRYKINENIFLKVSWLKYIYATIAYFSLALSMLTNLFMAIFLGIFRLLKSILFLPITLFSPRESGQSIGKSFAMGMVTIVVLLSPILLYFGGFYFLLAGEVDKENQAFLLKLHQYRTAIAVRDESRNLLGIMPNSMRGPSEYIDIVYDEESPQGVYKKSSNRESSLYVNEVPDFFWNVLVEREHKGLNFQDEAGLQGYLKGVIKGSFRGVNVSALLGKAYKGGGGSTLMNIMIKNLYGEDYFQSKKNRAHECPIIINLHRTICRKWVEYRAARDLFPFLAQNNGKEFKRWSAMHVPLVGATGAYGLYGLQAASAVMFGKKPLQLSRAEQSFFAASYLRSFRFNKLPSDKITQHKESDWKEVCKDPYRPMQRAELWECRKRAAKVMAYKVLSKQFAGAELVKQRSDLENEFEQMKRPDVPVIPKVLAHFFDAEKGSRDEKIKKYGNLRTRLDAFMPGFKILVKKELQSFMEKHPQTQAIEVVTTLPLNADFRFRKNIASEFHRLATHFPFNKKLTLNASIDDRASIRISVSDLEKGDIVRYYLQEGNNAIEEKVDLPPPVRSIASIAKIPLAVLLIKKGVKANDRLCDRSYHGKQNAGGDTGVKDCSDTFSFEESIARSKNLPLRYALATKTTEAELRTLYKDFGLQAAKNTENIALKANLIENLSFGTAKATATHTHRIINRVAQILLHKGRNNVAALHTIKTVRQVRYDDHLQASELALARGRNRSQLAVVSKYLQGVGRINTMKTVLSAPVKHSHGTLHFLDNIQGGKVLYGKTGTLDTDDKQHIKDKYTVGVVQVKQRYYSFSILVGTERYNGDGLIKHISSRKLMKPLVQQIVDSLRASS